jgi:arginine decarboxylase
VSATYVTPYPPGFPVLVPGQVFSREILQFMRDLDTPEIHGYLPDFGYRVYTEKAIEMLGESVGLTPNGHGATVHAAAPAPQKTPKKKSAKRTGFNGDQNVPEVGQDELLAEQQPGDAVRADTGA